MIVNRVTLLGNKDHGKSTLIGSLLMETGSISEQRIRDAKKTSKKLGRQFEPGYILDSFEEERLNEMTIDTTRAQVKYRNTGFEFIDVPGHEELMKNMLSGASYADFALLLISAKPDEGITGQTKRHIFVAKMLGIRKLVVAVNKLDAVNYSKERFEEIKNHVGDYLDKIGFKNINISFVPISAYNAENLVKRSNKTGWYKGKSLMDILVEVSKSTKKDVDGELIIQIQGFFDKERKSVFGKVISGSIKRGDRIILLPSGKSTKILKLFESGNEASSARKGSVVTLELDKRIGIDARGLVGVKRKSSCRSGSNIHAMLLTTKRIGGKPSIKMNGVEIDCMKMTVKKMIDVTTGESMVSGSIKPLNAGIVEIKLAKDIAMDTFEKNPEIGRFVFYTDRKFSGIGIITE
jgi:bifunctional enzyme CysN/CysC/sulfate adenylyltransferase subunit 1